MVRLKPGPRVTFGEKLLDLANLAATALIFGQFVGDQPLSWTIIATGMVIWLLITAMALRMIGGWRWKTPSGF